MAATPQSDPVTTALTIAATMVNTDVQYELATSLQQNGVAAKATDVMMARAELMNRLAAALLKGLPVHP